MTTQPTQATNQPERTRSTRGPAVFPTTVLTAALALLLGVAAFPALAEEAGDATDAAGSAPAIDDSAALAGVKATESVFLIDFTNPKKTAFYLDIIRGTHAGLVRQGVTPNMVLVFIGPTVQYLSTEPTDELAMEYGDELASIAESVKKLDESGVRMEVCAVATDVFDIDNASILPEMDVVADGFISLIGWQTQGHKLVPIF
ncbi:DsrE family protein [uncultured Thiohalocapsa sp.]|uniref:DsrE family protein n=1 Tax=uncultured Thiohalocapsa sp. TaxID=768990 RepID=UPI0025E0DB76|nr:DsrE family protein [uncultured Thiohalocapsa sp.]